MHIIGTYYLLGEINKSGSVAGHIIVSISDKSKSDITTFVLLHQVIPQLLDIVLDRFNVATH